LYISKTPAILARPLVMYLDNYEYTCTEQMISRALPYVLLPNDKANDKVNKTIQKLTNRQNDDGSFGMWVSGSGYTGNKLDATTVYLTAYTLNFLTLARRNGFNVPQSMYARGIDFLRDVAAQNTTSATDAFAK